MTPRTRRNVALPVLFYVVGTLAVPAGGGALGSATFRGHALTVLGVVAVCVLVRLLGAAGVRALVAKRARRVV